jgi:hypothetical protein
MRNAARASARPPRQYAERPVIFPDVQLENRTGAQGRFICVPGSSFFLRNAGSSESVRHLVFQAPTYLSVKPMELAPGTQLIVSRIGYRHHGIYIGNGRVIHYVRRIRYPEGLIEEVSILEFSRGSAVRVGRQPDGASRGQNVVLRARSRLGERRYDVVRNNCEHFCNWCQFGEHRSSQIDLLPRPVRMLLDALQRVRPKSRAA